MSWKDVLKGSKRERAERRKMRAQDRKDERDRQKKIKKLTKKADDWDYWHKKYIAHAEELHDEFMEIQNSRFPENSMPRFLRNKHRTKKFPEGETYLPEEYNTIEQLKNAKNEYREELESLK